MEEAALRTQAIEYFSNVLVQLNGALLGLMSLHATVLLAAVGWSISSRSHPRGLAIPYVLLFVVALGAFFAINLLSIADLYQKINIALEINRDFWKSTSYERNAEMIFAEVGKQGFGSVPYWLVAAIIFDSLALIGIAIALSRVGRVGSAEGSP